MIASAQRAGDTKTADAARHLLRMTTAGRLGVHAATAPDREEPEEDDDRDEEEETEAAPKTPAPKRKGGQKYSNKRKAKAKPKKKVTNPVEPNDEEKATMTLTELGELRREVDRMLAEQSPRRRSHASMVGRPRQPPDLSQISSSAGPDGVSMRLAAQMGFDHGARPGWDAGHQAAALVEARVAAKFRDRDGRGVVVGGFDVPRGTAAEIANTLGALAPNSAALELMTENRRRLKEGR